MKTVTTKSFKKGDVVWQFLDWNRRGVCQVQKLVIQSCGPKQATALVSGTRLKKFIYAGGIERLVLVSDMPDPTALALQRGAEFRQAEIDRVRNSAHNSWNSNWKQDYFDMMKRACQEAMDGVPQVIYDEGSLL